MHKHSIRNLSLANSQRGSTLVLVSIVIVLAASLVAVAMQRSQQSARLANFSEVNADLRSAAEGELERCFFLWKTMKAQQQVDKSFINTTDSVVPPNPSDDDIKRYLEAPPTSSTAGYNAGFAGITLGKDWENSGNLKYQFVPLSIGVKGVLAGSNAGNTVRGDISTYRMIVWATKASMGKGAIKSIVLGRTFVVVKAPLFQNAIFYNGTMELTPGGTMVVDGDISCNSDMYVGGRSSDGMTLKGSIRGPGKLNASTDFSQDIAFNAKGESSPKYFSPVFPSGRDTQVARTSQAQSFLQGVDTAKIQRENPTLFPLPNDVYHGIIDPPPSTGVDSPTMASQRMYNKAGLRIRVKADGSVEVSNTSGTVYPQFLSVFGAQIQRPVTDAREKESNLSTPAKYQIAMTTIDVSAFIAKLNATPVFNDWNGILYAYDEGTAKAGFRLINGASTFRNKAGAKENGFTVATNTGLYVQGDYNTATNSSNKENRCVVMADAVTGLSNNWNDNNSDKNVALRVASDTTYNMAVITGDKEQTVVVAGDGTVTTPENSGGPHNLVRLLEDWGGKTYVLKGSLVQLFQSKIFNSIWRNEAPVYWLPTNRYTIFDKNLAENPLTTFAELSLAQRGDYFTPYQGEEHFPTPTP